MVEAFRLLIADARHQFGESVPYIPQETMPGGRVADIAGPRRDDDLPPDKVY
jgi:hypothetical protein